MKTIILICLVSGFIACNSSDNSNEADSPRDPNEAVTNSTMIVNDSVIVPDTNNQGVNPSGNDTSRTKMN